MLTPLLFSTPLPFSYCCLTLPGLFASVSSEVGNGSFRVASSKSSTESEKHEVSFDEASTVFNDPLARIFDDPDHSLTEAREIIIGHSIVGRLIMVSFVEKEIGLVRIISARQTTNKERADYEENV